MANTDLAQVPIVTNALKTNYVFIEVSGSVRRISLANLLTSLGLSAFSSIPTTDGKTYGLCNGKLEEIAANDDSIVVYNGSNFPEAETLELQGEMAPIVPTKQNGVEEK